jgi:hypothetical protein
VPDNGAGFCRCVGAVAGYWFFTDCDAYFAPYVNGYAYANLYAHVNTNLNADIYLDSFTDRNTDYFPEAYSFTRRHQDPLQ